MTAENEFSVMRDDPMLSGKLTGYPFITLRERASVVLGRIHSMGNLRAEECVE